MGAIFCEKFDEFAIWVFEVVPGVVGLEGFLESIQSHCLDIVEGLRLIGLLFRHGLSHSEHKSIHIHLIKWELLLELLEGVQLKCFLLRQSFDIITSLIEVRSFRFLSH